MQSRDIERLIDGERAKLFNREPAMPDDLAQHLLGRGPGKSATSRAYDRAERKNPVVNGQQIDDIARLAAIGRCCRFVGGGIGRLQDLEHVRTTWDHPSEKHARKTEA